MNIFDHLKTKSSQKLMTFGLKLDMFELATIFKDVKKFADNKEKIKV